MVSRRALTAVVGAIGFVVLSVGWSMAASRTPKKAIDCGALNPAFKGATFVNDNETRRTCHEDSMEVYAGTTHAHVSNASSPGGSVTCESCHGPRSKHIETQPTS